jgi:hypothetical protein
LKFDDVQNFVKNQNWPEFKILFTKQLEICKKWKSVKKLRYLPKWRISQKILNLKVGNLLKNSNLAATVGHARQRRLAVPAAVVVVDPAADGRPRSGLTILEIGSLKKIIT